MATWYKTSSFKYFKNLIIGVGAALVMIGALLKIESLPYASEFLMVGLITEAILFLMLGLLPPDKDYYWEKLYPGIEDYHADVPAILPGVGAIDSNARKPSRALNAEVVEDKLGGMLSELQGMSKSMSSLKALQEVDFSKTKDQLKSMNDFYGKMNEAFIALQGSVEDAKKTQVELGTLSKSLASMNNAYSKMNETFQAMQAATEDAKKTQSELGILSKSLASMNGSYSKMNETFQAMQAASDDAKKTQHELHALAHNLGSMNKVYGNMLSAMGSK
jgi:methyl-accepting chemotaxis protein